MVTDPAPAGRLGQLFSLGRGERLARRSALPKRVALRAVCTQKITQAHRCYSQASHAAAHPVLHSVWFSGCALAYFRY